VGVETIRYYERRGLIPGPRPRGVGYREFTDEDARRVRFIKQAQGLGFTLKEIADLLALRVSRQPPCDDVRELAEAKLKDIEEELRTLRSFTSWAAVASREDGGGAVRGFDPVCRP